MKKNKKVLMIDSLIGSDYALILSEAIKNYADVKLIVPENKVIDKKVDFEILKWIPSKDKNKSKAIKIKSYFTYIARLLRYIVFNRPDAVHFQFFRFKSDYLLFPFISFLTHTVYTAHNVLPHERKNYDEKLHDLVYKNANSIIVHSEYIKEKLISNFNIKKKKVHIIPHGNYDQYLSDTELTKMQARKKIGLSIDDQVVLFFGYIREYKGLDNLLDAFKIVLNSDNKNIKLVIAGAAQSEDLRIRYKNKINEINSKSIFFFNDFIPNNEVAYYFESADVVVLPYKAIDHSGIVHLSYSFGKPIIATKVGDFPESIHHGKTGFILKNNTPEELAATIMESFSSEVDLAEMGKQGKRLSDTYFNWNNIAKQTVELY